MTYPDENDPLLVHEALDRTCMVAEIVETYIQFHPYMARNKDVSKLINKAANALFKAYQLIGSKTVEAPK